MPLVGGPSSLAQRDGINRLLQETFGIDAQSETFQRWKYWDPHPLFPEDRSYTLREGENIVAHGCCWPIHLQGTFGGLPSMHLIDWAAKRKFPGAGMQVLELCQKDVGAVFAIGGTEIAKKILTVLGFKPYNTMYFLYRPLRPLRVALRNSPKDWKLPARIVRNIGRRLFPRVSMPSGWSVSRIEPTKIPESLYPRPLSDEAASKRSPKLLTYMMSCPVFEGANCYLLRRNSAAMAYFCVASVRGQARLLDYGPNGLDEETATALGMAAQCVAHSDFKDILDMSVATTEKSVRVGLISSGFTQATEERIRVLKVNTALKDTTRFRLTPLDWDAAVL